MTVILCEPAATTAPCVNTEGSLCVPAEVGPGFVLSLDGAGASSPSVATLPSTETTLPSAACVDSAAASGLPALATPCENDATAPPASCVDPGSPIATAGPDCCCCCDDAAPDCCWAALATALAEIGAGSGTFCESVGLAATGEPDVFAGSDGVPGSSGELALDPPF